MAETQRRKTEMEKMSAFQTSYFQLFSKFEEGQLSLIDLRAPVEFSVGSMPQAKNIPLFSNSERSEIGTTYKQVGSKDAIGLGLEIFAKNSDKFIETILSELNPAGEIAIHCARGGMRSGFVAKLLGAMGVKVYLLRGGYKDYRQQVLLKISDLSKHRKLVLIGKTGSGKTEVLQALADGPVIDLEGLARHRGSALGGMRQDKIPATQQNFENAMASRYEKVKSAKIILLEHETSLGPVIVPSNLRLSLNQSRMILVERDFDERVEKLTRLYFSDFDEQQLAMFRQGIAMFSHQISDKTKLNLLELATSGKFDEITRILLQERYDKVYAKSLRKFETNTITCINLSADFGRGLFEIRKLLENA